MSKAFWIWVGILGYIGGFGCSCASAIASDTTSASEDAQYKEMLKIAQRKVERLNTLHASGVGNALSTSLVHNVLGRYYQVGDNWDVLVWQQSSTMAAKTSEPVKYRGRTAVFHYEVINVKPGAESQVTVKITQKEDFGLKVLDPRVSSLDLTMSDKFAQSKKQYHFANLRTYAASPNGLHTNISLLELCPLDVPDIYTAEQAIPTSLPELPASFSNYARLAGYSADLGKSVWFDQEDLFGRGVEILWQRGDLWPAYMKTPGGIAVLVRR